MSNEIWAVKTNSEESRRSVPVRDMSTAGGLNPVATDDEKEDPDEQESDRSSDNIWLFDPPDTDSFHRPAALSDAVRGIQSP
jgi:hypothetical protein